MFRYLAAGVCFLVTAISGSHLQAQIVRVGPYGHVSVRAPFVAVETSRWGGTYVRAPFTRVYTPPRFGVYVDPYYQYGYGYYPPAPLYYESLRVPVVVPVDPYPGVYAEPAYPAVEPHLQPAPASPEQVSAQLRNAAARLSNSLSRRRDDGDIWLDYLAPATIIRAIDQGDPPASLQPLLDNYDGVSGNRELISIVRADGYAETRRLLRQYVSGPAAAPTRSVIDVSRPAAQQETPRNVPTLAEPVEPAKDAPANVAPAKNEPQTRVPGDPDVTSI